MRRLILGCLTLIVLSGCTQPRQAPQPEPLAAPPAVRKERATSGAAKQGAKENLSTRIDQLLNQLASTKFKERETAQAQLATLLETKRGAVLAQLQKACKTTADAEVRDRLERLLAPYTRWQITPRILEALPNILEVMETGSRKGMRTAILALEKFDFRDSRGVLIAILRNKCKHGQWRALEALIENADSHVAQFFVDFVRIGTHYRPEWFLSALYRTREKSVPLLARLLNGTDDLQLLNAVAETLAELGEEGCRVLVEALNEAKPGMLEAVLRSLNAQSESALSFESLLPFVESPSPEVREYAAYLLGRTRGARVVNTLSKMVAEETASDVRQAAMYSLGEIGNKGAVPALIKALKDRGEEICEAAASALGKIRDERAIGALIELVVRSEEGVNSSILDALEQFDGIALPEIVKRYKIAEPSVRQTLTWLAKEICEADKDEQAKEFFLSALKDSNAAVRTNAAEALCFAEGKEVIDALTSMLKDPNPVVRYAAIDSLSPREGEEVSQALLSALEDTDTSVRVAAASELAFYGPETPDMRKIGDVLLAALKDTDEDVRGAAADALGRLGDRRAADALIKSLTDEDYYVRAAAAQALGELGDKQAVEALVRALKDQNEHVLTKVIHALAGIGDERALKPAAAAVRRVVDPNSETQLHIDVLNSLAKLGGTEAVPHLIEMFDCSSRNVRGSSLRTILRFGESAAAPLLEAAKSDKPRIRACALKGLAMLREEKGFELLLEALKHKSWLVRATAAESLSFYRDARAVEPLLPMLTDKDGSVRSKAAASLRHFPEARVVDSLVKMLIDDPSSYVCDEAAKSLGRIGDKRAAEALRLMLLDDSGALRGAAARALAAIKDDQATETIIKLLEEGYWWMSETAVDALGDMGDRRAIPALKKLLKTNNEGLQVRAKAALYKLGDEKAASEIMDTLKSTYGRACAEAARALGRSCPREILPRLVKLLESTGSVSCDPCQTAAAKAIGRTGYKSASDKLIDSLDDWSGGVRQACVIALGGLKEERAVEPLIEALANDKNDNVREAAVEALEEITGENFGWNWQRWRRWVKERE